jgi:hypothetical protein
MRSATQVLISVDSNAPSALLLDFWSASSFLHAANRFRRAYTAYASVSPFITPRARDIIQLGCGAASTALLPGQNAA